MAQTVAAKRPLLARAIVAALATVTAYIFTFIAYSIAREIGHPQLASGFVGMIPLTASWIAVALTQNLMRKD